MIGNDIVDLKLAEQQSNWRRKGFLEKVFTASERKILNASSDKSIQVWLLWSMKEAAYKAHQRKMASPRRLNWKGQECISLELGEDKAAGVMRIESECYFTSSTLTSDYIHSVAVENQYTAYRKWLSRLPLIQTKQHFKQEISELLKKPLSCLHLGKSDNGIPVLSYLDQPISVAFSFSDHGRFSGFCISLMDS